MTEKGLTLRTDERGLHLYRPRHAEDDTLRGLVTDLLDRAFGGSPAKLILQALNSRRATPEELGEIRRLLDAHEGMAPTPDLKTGTPGLKTPTPGLKTRPAWTARKGRD
jgi:predicted transcriptional regulator